ncbi:MAG: helix-turn-helix domain-containing protein [Bacillota bacterium]
MWCAFWHVEHPTFGCSRFVFNYFLGKQKEKDAYWRMVEEMKQNGQLPTNEWKSDYFNKYESVKLISEEIFRVSLI